VISQLAAELSRFAARRLTKVLLAFGVVALVVAGVVVLTQTKTLEQHQAEVRDQYDQQVAYCTNSGYGAGPRYIYGPDGVPVGVAGDPAQPDDDAAIRANCEQSAQYILDDAVDRQFRFTDLRPLPDPTPTTSRYGRSSIGDSYDPSLDDGLPAETRAAEAEQAAQPDPGWLSVLGLLLFLGALVAGASMVGADWQAGTFPVLLTWEPRRIRLFATKLVAVVVLAFVFAAVLQVVFSAVLYPTAVMKGTTAGMTGTWWRGVAETIVRSSAVAASGAVIGMGIAMLGRRTSLAIGFIALYLLVVENLVRAYAEQWSGWLLGNAITGAVSGQTQFFSFDYPDIYRFPVGQAFAVLGLYTAVSVVAATWSFARRDIGAA
jgi:ABC-type transport system involved in multi-copper enzyme maturation permease subunit